MSADNTRPDSPPAPVVTVLEACEVLGVGRDTVRNLVNDGTLPRLVGVRKMLIPRAAFDEYVRTGGQQP